MSTSGLKLPSRQIKPRKHGITILIDNGVPLNFFKDTINNASEFIDFVKFGWGTSIITKHLDDKIACLRENDVEFFFGGTLFEKFLSQNKIDEFYKYCMLHECKYIEISNGTIHLTNKEKALFISDFANDFHVLSEVGSKDSDKSLNQHSAEWIEYIQEDLEAGAKKVITEARESGTSGLCNGNGEMRFELIEEIISSGINIQDIVFEAPTKKMQTCFIRMVGPEVNLANIAFTQPIPLETLRLGLRSDTFYLFE